MNTHNDALLEYYKRELTYLRKMGQAFAERYPKVAGRLELGMDQSPDPHIERLIESFAFLTARLQYDLESEFPRLSTALLENLYPQLVNPVPAMTVAAFDADPTQGKLTSAHRIPAHTPLSAQTHQGQLCRFRTCYAVDLLPLVVESALFESVDRYEFLDALPGVALVLRLRLRSLTEPMQTLGFDRLRFYLHGDRMLVYALYELLFNHVLRVAVITEEGGRPRWQPADAIQPVGFSPEEAVLPYPPNAHPGYRLLQEFFTFPEKFLFMDLRLGALPEAAQTADLIFCLDQMPAGRLTVDEKTFRLGCTPIINLFPKTTEPVRIDHRRYEYRLNPDKRREKITEIHSIRSVTATSDERQTETAVESYFSLNHAAQHPDQRIFYYCRRQPTGRRDLPGTEMFLSFVDLDFSPARPASTSVFAHALCTNRRLAEDLPAGAMLQLEQAAPVAEVTALAKPTAQLVPPLDGAALWRLISHLSLNYLSFSDGPDGLGALREILRLYCFSDHPEVLQQINGIREMTTERVVRRTGSDGWRGFSRGFEIALSLDERLYVGSSAFLLAAVLNRFFPLYAGINTFTQLVLRSAQRDGEWKRWPPMAGEQIVA